MIKAHGSSDARAVKNAVRQAKAYLESGISDRIAECAALWVKAAPGDGEAGAPTPDAAKEEN